MAELRHAPARRRRRRRRPARPRGGRALARRRARATRPTAAAGARGPARCRPLPSAREQLRPRGGRRQRRRPRGHRAGRLGARRSARTARRSAPGSCGSGSARRRGPRSSPLTITQDTPVDPRHRRSPGDEFGAVVETGDMDSDGFADMIVAAVRENEGAGQRDRHPRRPQRATPGSANSTFDQDYPGRARAGRARPRVRLDAVGAAPLAATAGPTSRSPSAARTPPTSA